MDGSFWVSACAFGVTVLAGAAGYGALRQSVNGLKERQDKAEERVARCEDRHVGTDQRVGSMEVDLAVLKERSGTTITTLDRIEGKLDAKSARPTPRARAAK